MNEAEQPLTGGRSRPGVIRLGDTVRRPMSARSAYVHRVLTRLAAAGVEGVPRLLGVDDHDREILTYQQGDTGHDVEVWTDDQLMRLLELVRRIHDALAGTPEADGQETVCHHDIAPWNLILRSGVPVGLIDFDDVAAGARVEDLGYLSWVFLDLGSPRWPASEQGRRLRLVCDGYRRAAEEELVSVSTIEADLVDAVLAEHDRILDFRRRQSETSTDPDVRAFAIDRLAAIEQSRDWIRVHRSELEACLG